MQHPTCRRQHPTCRRQRSLLLSLACLFLVHSSGSAQPAAKAVDGPEVQLCLAGAADFSAVYPTRVFPAGTTHEVTAVVRLGKGDAYKKLEASWIAVDVGKAAPANPVISKTTLPVRGDRGAIHMRSGGKALPPGTYRLEVTADGNPWRAVEFSVAPVEAPQVKQPADLLPMKPGTVWRYAFEQQFASGVKRDMPPGLKLDADGRLRATITKTAAGEDSMGLHVESRRGDTLVEEEWWKLTTAGLGVTKIRSGGEENTFDPPGRIWPWPLKTPQRWTFKGPGMPVAQTFRMWGPVPLKWPEGEAPGYVVLMEQPSRPIALSVERQYVPGIGMVREVVVQAHNGVMLTRWDNVLMTKPEGVQR
jgi:hypothetical protein